MSIDELIVKTKERIADVEADKLDYLERAITIEYHRPSVESHLKEVGDCDYVLILLRENLQHLEDKKLYQQHRKDCK